MSLGIALNNAVSSLRLNQQALSVLSNNLANVNTDGYSRKVIEQTAVYVEGVGNGVKIDDVVRKVDTYLQRSVMSQGSTTQRLGAIDNYYGRLQVLLGEPGAQNSIDEYMTTFFNTMQQMADQPDRTSYRSNFVNASELLAQQVSGLAYELESLRFQADSDISGALTETNAALKKLYELNSAISRSSAVGQSTAGLLDERDAALKVVANNLDVTSYYEPNGTVLVTAGNGVPLVDGILHQLEYTPIASVDNLVNDERIDAIKVLSLDINNQPVGSPSILVSGGRASEVTSGLNAGKIQGLLELRDQLIPNVLDQLDMLASQLRDAMNALHNDGSGYPPARSLTGTRPVYRAAEYEWSGSVRIAVLSPDGQPIQSPYADEAYTGIRPMTLNLGNLATGGVTGRASIETIVDEINSYYGAPGNKAVVGNVNNIKLVSNTNTLPSGGTSLFDFDLDISNISGSDAQVFVSNVTVRDASNAVLNNALTRDVATQTLSSSGTYTTYANASYVDVKLLATGGIKAGDRIYLEPPALADVNGISGTQLGGYFVVSQVTGDTIRIETTGTANANGPVDDASGAKVKLAYDTVAAGEERRTREAGQLQVDLSAGISSPYYMITVNVGIADDEGNVRTSQITYRVENKKTNLENDRYSAVTATGDGHVEIPLTTQPALRALLVDANGNELPRVNGRYVDQPGYLKIIGGGTDYVVAIDEMDSANNGDEGALPPVPASGWGFSHFFGLNNFFASNEPIEGGDTVKGSAINLRVEQRIKNDPNLVSSGQLVLQTQPANPNEKPQYTYVRHAGDNSAAQAMANLSNTPLYFQSAGGLPNTSLSLQSYASEMLGYLASLSDGASQNYENAQLLYDGFNARAKAISGVNLDEELANTVIFQNSYAASARIVTVVNEMFKTLVDAT